MGQRERLATIWEVLDHLWEQIHPVILELDPPKARGRKQADPRAMLDGIIFRMRSGCQWNRLTTPPLVSLGALLPHQQQHRVNSLDTL